jgi:uncharacterized protein (TIGR02246 family)
MQPQNSPETPPNSEQRAIEHVLRQIEACWNAAANTWDADALSDIYAADAVLFGGLPELSISHAGIKEYFNTYKDILRSVQLRMVDQVLRKASDNTYVAQGFVNFTFQLTNGTTTQTRMRTTWVMVKQDDQWKLLAHHFSNLPEKLPV